jgi:hypothetical protein
MQDIQAYRLLSHWNGRSVTHVAARFCDDMRILRRINREGIWRGRRVNIIGTMSRQYPWSYVGKIECHTMVLLSDAERESMFINEDFYDKKNQ